jgi:hypothetical protein
MPASSHPAGNATHRTSGSDTAILQAHRHVAALAAKAGVRPDAVRVAAVPHFAAPLTVPPKAEIEKLKAHLRRVIRAVFRDAPEPEAATRIDPPRAIETTACAACRGHCCISGGKNAAFLTPQVVAAYRRSRPTASEAEVFEAYQSALPQRTVRGSCLYHGAKGCGLTRAMRSQVCNSYGCSDFLALPPGDGPAAIVSHVHGAPFDIRLVTADGAAHIARDLGEDD